MIANNELVAMTRRYPNLPKKALKRDSEIVKKIIDCWESEHNGDKVLSIYLKENKNLSDERYWELLRTVWIIAGATENADVFRKLMQSTRKERYYFSTPEDAKKLRDMPDTFQIYRAVKHDNDGGLAWTISKEYAEYYREIFHREKVISRIINKKDVFAFIERNKEYEIVLL